MTSKRLLLGLAAFGAASFAAATAFAAAPAYCALYSREYAIDTVQPQAAAGMLQSVQDQAYYRCLNQDEDPPLPEQSAYFGADINAGSASLDTGSTAGGQASIPPLPRPAPAPPAPVVHTAAATTSNASVAGYRPSGLTAWTPEWVAWCQQNFPNSWIFKTGTIQHFGTGVRELCQ